MHAERTRQPFTYEGESFTPAELKALNMMRLSDRMWRLDNLYHIRNEQGNLVPFRLRPVQRDFLENMWYFNVILKSRQHGFTTLIDLFQLDLALFTPNINVVIIAHRQENAAEILETKCLLPYTNLHPAIRNRITLTEQNKSQLTFSNGSTVTVQISGRSGTTQAMHISELGYTGNHRPVIAQEIITGSHSSVHPGSFCFIESTAMGTNGPFYKICQTAINMKNQRQKLTKKDYKFHFYAWYDKEQNQVSDQDAKDMHFSEKMLQYFQKLEDEHGIILSLNQKAWYVAEERTLQEKMKQENPSTAEEAFENSTMGNYFQRAMAKCRDENRICHLPHEEGRLVHLYFDIGLDDPTAIWAIQQVGPWFHVLYYYEETDLSLGQNIQRIQEIASQKKWNIGRYIGPHDLKHRRQRVRGPAISLEDECKKIGIEFEVVPKVAEKITSINVARRMIDSCRFDQEGCEQGISRLDNYRKEWLVQFSMFGDKPRKDENSDGADAFQCFAMAIEGADLASQRDNMARRDKSLIEQPSTTDDGTLDQPFSAPQPQKRNSMRGYT